MSKFPMDLSQFKKVKEDHAFTTLKHTKGHEVKIAHAALDKNHQKQLKKLPMALSQGGEAPGESDEEYKARLNKTLTRNTEDPPAPELVKDDTRREEGTSALAGAFKAGGGEIKDPYTPIKKENYKKPLKFAHGGGTPGESADDSEVTEDSTEDSTDDSSQPQAPVTINLNTAGQPTANIDPSQLNPKAVQQPLPSQQATQQPITQQSAQQQPVTSPSDPYGVQAQQEALQKGIAMQMSAQDLGAGGVQKLAKAQSDILQQQIAQQNQQLQTAQQHYNDYNSDANMIVKNIQDQKIDPSRVWNDKSTVGKIGTVIGLALGGLSAGWNRTENPALKLFNQQVEQDLEAQKANLGKQQNLLSALNQHYGNQVEADNMFKVIQGQQIASMIDQAGAQAKTPQAQAAAMQAKGQILSQNAQVLGHMAAQKTALSGIGGSQQQQMDPAQAVPFLVPPDQQKEVFKEISQAQNAAKNKDAFLQAFDKAVSENTVLGRLSRAGFTPPSIKAMNMLSLPLIHDLEGRVNEYEQKTVQDNMPELGDKESTVAAKRKAMEDFFDQKMAAPTAKGFGIDLGKFQSTAPKQQEQQQQPEVKTFQGVKYQKVAGGWKKTQ